MSTETTMYQAKINVDDSPFARLARIEEVQRHRGNVIILIPEVDDEDNLTVNILGPHGDCEDAEMLEDYITILDAAKSGLEKIEENHHAQ